MKIYLFNPVTGAYLGEAFADESPWQRGEYLIPDDATRIPPPWGEPGKIPFFDIREQRWVLVDHPGSARNQSRDTLDTNG